VIHYNKIKKHKSNKGEKIMNAFIKSMVMEDYTHMSINSLLAQYKEKQDDYILASLYQIVSKKLEYRFNSIKQTYKRNNCIDDFESDCLYLLHKSAMLYELDSNANFITYYMRAINNREMELKRSFSYKKRNGVNDEISIYTKIDSKDDGIELIDIFQSDAIYDFDKCEILSMFTGKERELVEIILDEKIKFNDRKYAYKKLNCNNSKFNRLKQHIKEIILQEPSFMELLQNY
jgi:hypothetical protein